MRKRDSFNSKARPVSSASIDSNKRLSGIRPQSSVKRKDARPPSIAEGEGDGQEVMVWLNCKT